jgi:hypothetical protein
MAELPFDPTRRNKTTQAEVLKAFAERIRSISGFSLGLNEQNVVISDQPIPSMFPGGRMCIVVCGGDGRFTGPSQSQQTEDSTVIVGIYIHNRRDRAGRSESKLLDEESIFDLKHKLIHALKVAEPNKGSASRDWEPTRILRGPDRQSPLLRQPPKLLRSIGPVDVGEQSGWVGLQLHFSAIFDWDI